MRRHRPRRVRGGVAGVLSTLLLSSLWGGCELSLSHRCQVAGDCLGGRCVAGVCREQPRIGDDAAMSVMNPDAGANTDATEDATSQTPSCGPSWPDWPMPAPPSLTGFASDPQRSLPNPQSYDTSHADVVLDNVTHLAWQRVMGPDALSFVDAQQRCADLVLGGRTDWRLPSRIELVSLIDFTRARAGNIDGDAFPDPGADQIWACTPGPANPLYAWIVDFGDGVTFLEEKTTRYRVRCIAGAGTSTPPSQRYDRGIAGEVLDTRTLLHWKSSSIPDPVNWGQAYEQCRNLGTGWRLPSLTELQTLIDETRVTSAVDAVAFPDSPDDFFWTSSFFDSNPNYAWFVSIGAGNTYWIPTSEVHRARCVR